MSGYINNNVTPPVTPRTKNPYAVQNPASDDTATYPTQAGASGNISNRPRSVRATDELPIAIPNANNAKMSEMLPGQQFIDNIANFPANPISQLGVAYGKDLLAKSQVSRYLSLDSFRYYFNVNNSYVLNKLQVLFAPMRHKSWKRLESRFGNAQETSYNPPREDINAPDLYIPFMGFMTWVLLYSFVIGHSFSAFTPELMGSITSRGLTFMVLEVLIIKGGFFFFEDALNVYWLDIVAYCGYIFVLIVANLVVGLLFGSVLYYITLLVTSTFIAMFMAKTLRQIAIPENSGIANSRDKKLRKYFLLGIAGLQFVLAYFLGIVA